MRKLGFLPLAFLLACSADVQRTPRSGGGGGGGTKIDSGLAGDADTIPTGRDAGLAPDAIELPDSGFAPDAIDGVDGGFAPDAIELPDLGFAPDALAPPDLGVSADAGAAGPDAGPTTPLVVGAPCTTNAQCGRGTCIASMASWWQQPFSGGYCTLAACAQANPCPSGSECIVIDNQMNTTCLDDCAQHTDCRTDYYCHEVGVCLPGARPPPGTGTSPIGGACTVDGDCRDRGGSCITSTGFTGGYCTVFSCSSSTPCPSGSTCYTVNSNGTTACLADCMTRSQCRAPAYACQDPGACLPSCTPTSCTNGEVCGSDGRCAPPNCTMTGCGAGLVCDSTSGNCVVNVGTPPPGPAMASCSTSPSWECTGTATYCNQLVPFEPVMGPGYDNYPLNGETASNQYRSFVARDVRQLVMYATAEVECLTRNWPVGNGLALGLGDMSEANGAIPGTSLGQPAHPAGTHVNGRDMDIAYYQLMPPNNYLRAVCPHTTSGRDQYHCVGPPTNLDIWRTALVLGKMHVSPRLRVIGVDGQIGPLIASATTQLCARGWLSGNACTATRITYETTDMGRGWFAFHHHHFHISISARTSLRTTPVEEECLTPSCRPALHDHEHFTRAPIELFPLMRLE